LLIVIKKAQDLVLAPFLLESSQRKVAYAFENKESTGTHFEANYKKN